MLNFANCIDIDRLRVILWRICELGWGRGRGANNKGGPQTTPSSEILHKMTLSLSMSMSVNGDYTFYIDSGRYRTYLPTYVVFFLLAWHVTYVDSGR